MRRLFALCALIFSLRAHADDYHYREALIGERAAGLGGAYIAVADDPSGMWYNPAGIMFSFENYFSMSANVYTQTTEVYRSTIAGQDYTYSSQGLVPSFFGFTQNVGKSKWGFAMVVFNDDRIDQNDMITGVSSTVGGPNMFTRKFFRQNTSTAIGFAYATEVAKNATFGISTFGVYKSDKSIDNQLITFNADAGGRQRFYISNTSLNVSALSLLPKLGFQWMPKKEFAVGAVLSKKMKVSGSRNLQNYQTALDPATGRPTDDTGVLDTDLKRTNLSVTPKDASPVELGLGVAYFPRPSLLTSFDVVYYTADAGADEPTQATINVASGVEFYTSEKSAIRVGFYTNNANTPKVQAGGRNQSPNVDVYNLTIGYSVSADGSSFSFGTQIGSGKGKGQAIGNDTAIQTIDRTSASIFLTGSYQM